MAPTALGVTQRKAHRRGLAVRADEEPNGVEGGYTPDGESHAQVASAMALDAADRGIFHVVEASQIAGRRRGQALKLLVVEMARDAEVIVTLLRGKPCEKEDSDKEGPRHPGGPDSQAPRQRPRDDRGLLPRRQGQRTVTVTGLANMMWPEGPAGPPRGKVAPVGVVTVPTSEARSVP